MTSLVLLLHVFSTQGARMVRELFQMARSKKACLIFFDEVDAIGGEQRQQPYAQALHTSVRAQRLESHEVYVLHRQQLLQSPVFSKPHQHHCWLMSAFARCVDTCGPPTLACGIVL